MGGGVVRGVGDTFAQPVLLRDSVASGGPGIQEGRGGREVKAGAALGRPDSKVGALVL